MGLEGTKACRVRLLQRLRTGWRMQKRGSRWCRIWQVQVLGKWSLGLLRRLLERQRLFLLGHKEDLLHHDDVLLAFEMIIFNTFIYIYMRMQSLLMELLLCSQYILIVYFPFNFS